MGGPAQPSRHSPSCCGRVWRFLWTPFALLALFIRRLVSGDKIRTRGYGTDLDMSYVSDTIVAMAFPASGIAQLWRNPIGDVRHFFRQRHGPGHFKVFNLSEIPYKTDKLDHAVEEFGFPDHHNPPIDYLFQICCKIEDYLQQDPRNAVSIHCLAGRGRTGTVIASYLVFSGAFDSGSDALEHFANKRSHINRGVAQPSQRRYVQYFSELVTGFQPERVSRNLKEVVLYGVPRFDRGGCSPILEVRSAPTQSSPSILLFSSDPRQTHPSAKIPRYLPEHGRICFPINFALPPLADVYIRVFHINGRGKGKKMFRFGFNTGFVTSGVLRFTLQEIDDACKDKGKHFDKDFFMDLTFEDCEPSALNLQRGLWGKISSISEDTLEALRQRRDLATASSPEPISDRPPLEHQPNSYVRHLRLDQNTLRQTLIEDEEQLEAERRRRDMRLRLKSSRLPKVQVMDPVSESTPSDSGDVETMEEVEGDYNSDSDEDLNEEEGCQENVVLLPGL